MDRQNILEQAIQIVTKDRNATHGNPEDNFQTIANLWNAYLGEDAIITPAEVAIMCILIKVARVKASPNLADNWIDIAGYAACGGNIATERR